METSKATIAGVLDIACGVLGLIGGSVLLILGLVGSGVIAATVPSDLERLSILPLALFVPLSLMTLGAGALAVIGGLSSLQRRRLWLAVCGSVAAMICFPPAGIAAMILIVLAEPEFAGTGGMQVPSSPAP